MSGPSPVELLRQLIRFDTTNPPGREAECIGYLREVLSTAGVEAQTFALDPGRPNLVARVGGRGEAPPLLLYGHVDVVPTADQAWTVEPFSAEERDGFVWGRGALDMKGAVAMFVSAFMRWAERAAAGDPPPGDLVLCVVADEEAGGVFGARFMVEEHADQFQGVRHALGEFGGFSLELAGTRLYPVMVAEKQSCRVTAAVTGPGGHGSLPLRGGAMAALGAMLRTLDRRRLPVHVTEPVRLMVEAMASAVGGPRGAVLRAALNPLLADRVLAGLGPNGRTLEAVLHNTVNATVVRGGSKVNVIPGRVEVELDGRLLPGMAVRTFVEELRALVGPGVELTIDHFDPGPAGVDMAAFEGLAGVLRGADPAGRPVPYVLPAVTDARFFTRLGIQTYGFTPMRLPAGFDFASTIHAADERVPATEIAWGADRVFEAVARYRA